MMKLLFEIRVSVVFLNLGWVDYGIFVNGGSFDGCDWVCLSEVCVGIVDIGMVVVLFLVGNFILLGFFLDLYILLFSERKVVVGKNDFWNFLK